MEIELNAIITCLQCGFTKHEQMPPDTWVIFYQCASCGAILRPKDGDCCVYCSYSNKHCPSKQKELGELWLRESRLRHLVADLDGVPPFGDLRQAKVAALREPHQGGILQSETQEELDALLPSVLDRAFKGEL